ncbi:MAG: hypothetical protein HYR97_07440 [Candidatus Melainabacteria bacterium]|nr:hypothetical protein [Candidatus Melainabacteria bacterium]
MISGTKEDTISKLKKAKSASRKLATKSNKDRSQALDLINKELLNSKDEILKANVKDIEEGKKNNLTSTLLDRLMLNEKRLLSMSESLKKVAGLPDPLDPGRR